MQNNPMRKQVFDFIVNFKAAHDGNSPSFCDIKQACGLRSKNSVSYHMVKLVKAGTIEYDGQRMIAVTGGRWKEPADLTPAFPWSRYERNTALLDHR
jgi:SOS-response transcriptional repressor LexA